VATGSIGRRYATALLQLVDDKRDGVGKTIDVLEALAGAIQRDEKLAGLLRHPNVALTEKKTVIIELAKKLKASPLELRFLHVLGDKGRLAHLPEIARVFRDLADRKAGRQRAVVSVARKINEKDLERLKEAFETMTGMDLIIDIREQSNLLGGIKVDLGNRTYDATIRAQLKQLKRTMISESLTSL